jgi:hypothetical protein
MPRLVVPYKKAKNAEAFDRHDASVHMPLAKNIPA